MGRQFDTYGAVNAFADDFVGASPLGFIDFRVHSFYDDHKKSPQRIWRLLPNP
jgi:hypothetical protein